MRLKYCIALFGGMRSAARVRNRGRGSFRGRLGTRGDRNVRPIATAVPVDVVEAGKVKSVFKKHGLECVETSEQSPYHGASIFLANKIKIGVVRERIYRVYEDGTVEHVSANFPF